MKIAGHFWIRIIHSLCVCHDPISPGQTIWGEGNLKDLFNELSFEANVTGSEVWLSSCTSVTFYIVTLCSENSSYISRSLHSSFPPANALSLNRGLKESKECQVLLYSEISNWITPELTDPRFYYTVWWVPEVVVDIW